MRHRFKVIEYSDHYAVQDTATGEEKGMGDGVDTLFTKTGKAMSPGSEYFRKKWEVDLNIFDQDTLEAYFPDQYEKEGGMK